MYSMYVEEVGLVGWGEAGVGTFPQEEEKKSDAGTATQRELMSLDPC